MRVKLKDIVPNPFRSLIGELSEHQIKSVIESCEMTGFGKKDYQFDVRQRDDGKYEVVTANHRLEGFTRFYGPDHEVNIAVKDYGDDQMFTEMCRENLTQRNDPTTQMPIILAMKKWLEKSATVLATSQGKRTDLGKNYVSAKQVADALAKNGMALSRETVRKALVIAKGLAPDLKDKVGSDLSPTIANHLSTFDHEEQRDLVNALGKSSEQIVTKQEDLISKYKQASDSEREAVRSGEKDIALVGMELTDVAAESALDPEIHKLNEILNRISIGLDRVISLATDEIINSVQHASPEPKERLFNKISTVFARLNKLRMGLDTKITDQEVVQDAVVL